MDNQTPSKKHLHGKVVNGKFQFDCGYEITKKQAEWIVGVHLEEDDQVQFDIINPDYFRHQHKYQCACGKVHE